MIFWEGWLLSQYDAVFRECFRILLWHMESSDAGSVVGDAALMDKFHDVLEQHVLHSPTPLSKQP